MEYMDADGSKKTPYIIHRTSMGCYERTLALLIEKYAGALPTWMAPEQVRVLPVTDRAATTRTGLPQAERNGLPGYGRCYRTKRSARRSA